ncbi:hypothetical protein LMH73_014435 [Vibrio splendidus]|nr:hypothetical protein [Vibrio splendidus]MCC4882508.1 hypothetical protein [Vibrio splendidus]
MRRIRNKDYEEIDQAVSDLKCIVDDMHELASEAKREIELILSNYRDCNGCSVSDYMEKIDDAKDKVRQLSTDVLAGFDDYTSERSEKWHESDVAEDVSEWRSEWEDLLVLMDSELLAIISNEPLVIEDEHQIETPRQDLY